MPVLPVDSPCERIRSDTWLCRRLPYMPPMKFGCRLSNCGRWNNTAEKEKAVLVAPPFDSLALTLEEQQARADLLRRGEGTFADWRIDVLFFFLFFLRHCMTLEAGACRDETSDDDV